MLTGQTPADIYCWGKAMVYEIQGKKEGDTICRTPQCRTGMELRLRKLYEKYYFLCRWN